ncbi:glycosyltransferase 87 family protein [Streptomyces sp. NPDC006739]|uniref:glycosyltransferase 87 family protein n=1 Tax=Streptomyces sp. NPDC006739 TaxID=3364763 RepID=UPI0036864E96
MTTDDNERTLRTADRGRAVAHAPRTGDGHPLPYASVWMAAAGVFLFGLVGASAPNHNTLRAAVTWLRLPAMSGTVSQVATSVAIVLSCAGTLGMLNAQGRGWRPDPRTLFRAGAFAVLLVADLTPIGSSDTASYAAYGRIAALGGDPYVTTPAQLGGAYAHLVSDAWRDTPSVYGPVGTWWQAAAAFVGGGQPWLTIWALMLVNAAVFLATGYLLMRTADDPVRAALLWSANPLLIGVLAGGGHLDTVIAALAVAAVHVARRASGWREDLLVGALVGLACGVKISAALVGVGVVWPLLCRGLWQRAFRVAGTAALTLAVLYGGYGLHALDPLTEAAHMVSRPSLWAVFEQVAADLAGLGTAATAVGVLWPVLMLGLALVVHRYLPAEAPAAVTVPFALAFAWILTAPWSMPWYAALPCALAALFRHVRLTQALLAATAVLALLNNGGGHGW